MKKNIINNEKWKRKKAIFFPIIFSTYIATYFLCFFFTATLLKTCIPMHNFAPKRSTYTHKNYKSLAQDCA